MKLSDAVVLAKFPSIIQSCVFSEGIQIAGKIETSIPIHLLLAYFAKDKAMNIS